MIETTITILSQYPFQTLLMAVVLHRVVRDGLEALAAGRRKPQAATQRQAA